MLYQGVATMATDEELIEAIKRPDRYYHITIGGYGGETTYARISYAAYMYWADKEEQTSYTMQKKNTIMTGMKHQMS